MNLNGNCHNKQRQRKDQHANEIIKEVGDRSLSDLIIRLAEDKFQLCPVMRAARCHANPLYQKREGVSLRSTKVFRLGS